jgi:hypothetical protein
MKHFPQPSHPRDSQPARVSHPSSRSEHPQSRTRAAARNAAAQHRQSAAAISHVPVFAQVGSALSEFWAMAVYGARAATLDSIAELRRIFGKREAPMHRDAP